MPSRACTSLLRGKHLLHISCYDKVSMPSRACTSLLLRMTWREENTKKSVNALSGLYLIATVKFLDFHDLDNVRCQCPLGLVPHCYCEKGK